MSQLDPSSTAGTTEDSIDSPANSLCRSCVPLKTTSTVNLSPSLAAEISREILNVIGALYALKILPILRPTGLETQSFKQRSRISPPSTRPQSQRRSEVCDQSAGRGSPGRCQSQASVLGKSTQSRECTKNGGPFIRLVTQCSGTLVHLGQLVEVSEDQTDFLLQHVVSFDPRRAQLHVLADLKPADILALSESKREHERRLEKSKGVSLLSEIRNNLNDCDANYRSVQTQVDNDFDHGPVLITPGLVLIRVDQVRELGVIPEAGCDSSFPWLWPIASTSNFRRNKSTGTSTGNSSRLDVEGGKCGKDVGLAAINGFSRGAQGSTRTERHSGVPDTEKASKHKTRKAKQISAKPAPGEASSSRSKREASLEEGETDDEASLNEESPQEKQKEEKKVRKPKSTQRHNKTSRQKAKNPAGYDAFGMYFYPAYCYGAYTNTSRRGRPRIFSRQNYRANQWNPSTYDAGVVCVRPRKPQTNWREDDSSEKNGYRNRSFGHRRSCQPPRH
ncbi:unnamed protein product [Calicophoron daubneyi]|uniref:Uncharacterized protein n=1 Tax=Calicophoron daubneyi TaxID=300641 RepID=A0AAV2T4Y8_CALDB